MSRKCPTCQKWVQSTWAHTHKCLALMTDHDRFAVRIVCDLHTHCWIWTGARQLQHGSYWWPTFWANGKTISAPRYAWEQAHGRSVPEGLQVLHRLECSTSLCVRPGHLYIGTHADNMNDRWMAGGYARS